METTFKKDRARYMGVWTLMITLGVSLNLSMFVSRKEEQKVNLLSKGANWTFHFRLCHLSRRL